MDFKYHAVWHVLIIDSWKREYSSAKHTTQSRARAGHHTYFCPTTADLAYVKCRSSGFSNNLGESHNVVPKCDLPFLCVFFF